MTFGAKIKKYRKEHYMTQEMLANKLGVTKQEICRFEKNHITPRIKTIERYARILDLPITYLFCDDIVTEDDLNLADEKILKALWRYVDADEYGTPILRFPGLVDSVNMRNAELAEEKANQEYKIAYEELKKHPLGRWETMIIMQLRKHPELRIVVQQILDTTNVDKEKHL